ncbi:MAG: CPBP family intramembrane glutamic endopeptidase [Bacteroidota bacterium]
MTKERIVLLSPFLIIGANLIVAYTFGQIIGKWAFIPMILMGWMLWSFFIIKYGGIASINKWLQKPSGKFWWTILVILIGLIPLPLFLSYYDTLSDWTIWLPWIILALINPWIEEFYWRGLLLDHTKNWSNWMAVLYSSILFALNHAAFGINSDLNSGYHVVVSTLIMGIVWGFIYLKTKSLRWAIFSHFMVDFFNLSAASFMDLYDKGPW